MKDGVCLTVALILNSHLDGVVIVWKLKTRRPICKWKAHKQSCLQVKVYDRDKLIR